MIKSLTKYEIKLTPFTAVKTWEFSNQLNNDLILCENGDTIALEFLDYGDGSTSAFINSICSIALEQQEEDLIIYREGQLRTGFIYPDSEPSNLDGTYKRTIYSQISTTFYNHYRDPLKMWGLENIDFELSKTKKFLSDKFRVFYISPSMFGDKIIPTTIQIVDNTLDNPYIITDDGNENLIAGTNLFSKDQEVGFFTNEFLPGNNNDCDGYFNILPTSPIISNGIWLFCDGVYYKLYLTTDSGIVYLSIDQVSSIPSNFYFFNIISFRSNDNNIYEVYLTNTLGVIEININQISSNYNNFYEYIVLQSDDTFYYRVKLKTDTVITSLEISQVPE